MSKLREKFIKILLEVDKIDGTECEQITDDFSVKFAEFYLKYINEDDDWDLEIEEILQIFKDTIYGKE